MQLVTTVRTQKFNIKTVEFKDPVKKTYTKYYFANNRLCGAILIGDTSNLAKVTQDMKESRLFKDIFK